MDRDRFSKLVGRKVTVEEMTRWLPWLGVDIDEKGSDYVKIEFNPNRIDFSSYIGVARAFRGLMGWETGSPKYSVCDGKIVLHVHKTVEAVRPHIVGAVVRNLQLDHNIIQELMEMQEDLHWGVGRNREKASIGVHNLDSVKPPFTYKAVPPEAVQFIPLEKKRKMSLKEVLTKHEKGIEYAHLISWSSKYPLLVDAELSVLSLPPIINGELTRVDENTRNLFIDVTGTNFPAISKSLNVLTCALADMGGDVEKVEVKYPDRKITSPDYQLQKMRLNVNYANRTLGLKLSATQIVNALRKCRLDAKTLEKDSVEVSIPPFRIDVIHEIDLVEEVLIGYGYYKLKPTMPKAVTVGEQHEVNRLSTIARQIMIGLGFTEVVNFILTNEATHYYKMNAKSCAKVKLANPVSKDYSIAREYLLPSLMKNLAENKHQSFPQKIFEVSDVIKARSSIDTRCTRQTHLAATSSHATANFTEIKSNVEALLSNLNLRRWRVEAIRHPSFLHGRVATIYHKKVELGVIGEIHPKVLNNFELETPVSAFEINLEILYKPQQMKRRLRV